MNIIIDTSALISVIANEPTKNQLIQMTKGHILLAPRSIHWEIGNAFSAMLKRKRVTLAKANRAIQIYQKIPLRFIDIDLRDSLHLADELKIYAYDAYFVQSALQYKAPLLTLDNGLKQAARQKNVILMEVNS